MGPILHNPSTSLDILPQLAGRIEIGAAIVYAGECGEHVLKQERASLKVSNGAVNVVAQDRFADDLSISTIRSPTGKHFIRRFATRFEVYDTRSNDLLIARVGREPNFSPTGRFVVAQITSSAGVEVFDLYGPLAKLPFVTQADQLMLVWANNDSFLIAVGNRWNSVDVYNIVSDEKALVASGGGCHACNAWEDRRVFIDLNHGYIAVLPSVDAPVPSAADVSDLYRRSPAAEVQPNDITAYFSRKYFFGSQVDLPSRWDLNSPLKLSHYFNRPFNNTEITDEQKREDANRLYFATVRFLVSHPSSKAVPASGEAQKSGWLTAQVRAGRDVTPSVGTVSRRRSVADSSAISDRLSQVGLELGPPFQAAMVYERAGNAHEPTVQRTINALVAPIRAKMKHNQLEALLAGDDCREGNHVDFLNAADRIFKWSDDGSTFWLVNTQCVQGSGAFMYGSTYLFMEFGSKITLVDLKTDFRTAGGGWAANDARVRLFRLSSETIGIASAIAGQLKLVNIRRPDEKSLDFELFDASLVSDIRMTADRRHIVQMNSDGQFFVARLSNKTRVLSGAYADDEVVVVAEGGHYDSTFEGAQLVNVRFTGIHGLHRFSQFEAPLYRPGLAKRVLAETFDEGRADLASPPRLTFRIQKDSKTAGHFLATAAIASERPVKDVRLFVEGRLTKAIPVPPERNEISFNFDDPGAGRWITAVAVDESGLVSQPNAVKIPGSAQPRGLLHGVYIGVDNYRDPAISKLRQAKYDATNLATAIKGLKGRLHTPASSELLLDEAATRDNILIHVRRAAERTTESDRLVIFFAGHGVRGDTLRESRSALYLTGYDSTLADLRGTAVAWDDVSDALSAARGTVIVVIDACHSGFAAKQNLFSNDSAATALLGKNTEARIILAASKGRQESEESPVRGGEFTNALVSILSGRTNTTRTDLIDIYSSLKSSVVKSTSGRQTPWLVRSGLVGEMSLF